MKPRKRLKFIFWDSCIFFAWIKDEPWPDDIKKGIEQTLEQAYSNQLAIVTSSVTLAEVIQSQLTKEQKERYAKIFQHPNLQLYDIDRRIAGKAGVIREAYDARVFNDKGQPSGAFMSLCRRHWAVSEKLEFTVAVGSERNTRGRRRYYWSDVLTLSMG